jgi:predicted phosphodiesterase
MADAGNSELVATYANMGASLVVYGHIHRPFVRKLDGMTVANSGSVGSPLDSDPRASYLLIEDGRPRVVRVEYDVEREVRLLLRSGYPDAQRIAAMRRSGTFVALGAS